MIKLINPEVKRDLLINCRKIEPAGLYVNEDLTPCRARLLFALRQARKKFNGKLGACGSIDGRVFVYVKPPNPEARH